MTLLPENTERLFESTMTTSPFGKLFPVSRILVNPLSLSRPLPPCHWCLAARRRTGHRQSGSRPSWCRSPSRRQNLRTWNDPHLTELGVGDVQNNFCNRKGSYYGVSRNNRLRDRFRLYKCRASFEMHRRCYNFLSSSFGSESLVLFSKVEFY